MISGNTLENSSCRQRTGFMEINFVTAVSNTTSNSYFMYEHIIGVYSANIQQHYRVIVSVQSVREEFA
ncbi:hypothetical protein ANTQUA_LOCUS6307 [Anthophora quadrimaculata]